MALQPQRPAWGKESLCMLLGWWVHSSRGYRHGPNHSHMADYRESNENFCKAHRRANEIQQRLVQHAMCISGKKQFRHEEARGRGSYKTWRNWQLSEKDIWQEFWLFVEEWTQCQYEKREQKGAEGAKGSKREQKSAQEIIRPASRPLTLWYFSCYLPLAKPSWKLSWDQPLGSQDKMAKVQICRDKQPTVAQTQRAESQVNLER